MRDTQLHAAHTRGLGQRAQERRAPWCCPHWPLSLGRKGTQDSQGSSSGAGADEPHPNHAYLFGDVAVLVNVVEVKGPLELLLDCPSKEDGEAHHKVLGEGRVRSHNVTPTFYF